MQTVITMAGLGTRFKKAGYDVPKYEIISHGRSLFYWSMSSLKKSVSDDDDFYFIVRAEDNAAGFIQDEAAKVFGSCKDRFHVIQIDAMTDGQATTALLAAPCWKPFEPLLIYNIDTYVEPGHMMPKDGVPASTDGFIPCFNAPGDHWSFVETDKDGIAVQVREKQRISDNCTIGAYWFSSCALYERMYEEYYKNGQNMEKGEKYVAPLYNHMITKGMTVRICNIGKSFVHVLGTPEELQVFENEEIREL